MVTSRRAARRQGLNVVLVSRQLGHAHPGITLQVYSHLFEQADHAATAREALDAGHTAINGTSVTKPPLW